MEFSQKHIAFPIGLVTKSSKSMGKDRIRGIPSFHEIRDTDIHNRKLIIDGANLGGHDDV